MAALREMSRNFRFSGGVDTKTDQKSVPPARLLELENGIFTEATSIKKRNGYERVSQVPGAVRHATRGDELLTLTRSRAWSLAPDDTWVDTGAVFSAEPRERPLVITGTDQLQSDMATNHGITVAAWEDSAGGVWWNVVDEVTGHVYRPPTQADANGQAPRCVPCGDNLHVYFAVPSTSNISVLVVNPLTPTAAVVATPLVGDLDAADPRYDACPTNRTNTPAAIAWFESGSTNLRIGYVDQGGKLGVPLTGHPPPSTFSGARLAGSPIGVAHVTVDGANADRFALAYITTSGLSGRVGWFSGGINGTTVITSVANHNVYVPTSVQRLAIALAIDTTAGTKRAWVAFEEAAAAASNRFVVSTSAEFAAGASGVSATQRSVGLATRAFAIGTDAFAVVVHDTTFFNVYQTIKISDAATDGFVYAGRHAPGGAAGAPVRKHLSSAHVIGSVAAFALPVRERLLSENDDKFTETGIRLFTLDFASDRSHQHAGLGRGLYMGGGCPLHYDGRVWAELGFNVGPEVMLATPAGGGSMTASTTYLYRAWYEQTDAQGEIHRGPTSPGLLVTMAGGQTQVTLTLPTCRLTRRSGVRLMLARSKAAATASTSQLFRVTSLDTTTVGAVNGYIANSTTVDTVTFVDRMSDTTLATFDELYTDGGVFSNDPVSLGSAMARGKERLFASDPSDGSVVRYSQQRADGYGIEWPPEGVVRTDPAGGDVTALAVRDDRVVVWTERAIFTFAGDGPDAAGSTAAGGFSAVQLVPGDVGCNNPASILLTPQGFMFDTDKGIWRLDNAFSLEYVGAPVEGYNAQAIRRGTIMPGRTQALFLTDSGLSLLYDYLFGQWSTFTNHEGQDSAVAAGRFYYIRTDGTVYRETIDSFSDDNIRIQMKFVTAWLHMLDYLQGFQKFFEMRLVGTWLSAHQLGVQYELDYAGQWSDVVWYDATGATSSAGWITGANANPIGEQPISGSEYGDGEYGAGEYGGTAPGIYEWRLALYEKGESIRFQFQDFEALDLNGPSFKLTELVLTGAALGVVRRPVTSGRSA